MTSFVKTLELRNELHRQKQQKQQDIINKWIEENKQKWIDELKNALSDVNNWKRCDIVNNDEFYEFSYDLVIVCSFFTNNHNIEYYNRYIKEDILDAINNSLNEKLSYSNYYSSRGGNRIYMRLGIRKEIDNDMKALIKSNEMEIEKQKMIEQRECLEKANAEQIAYKNEQRRQYQRAKNTLYSQIENAMNTYKNLDEWKDNNINNDNVYCYFSFDIPWRADDLFDIVKTELTKRVKDEWNDDRFVCEFIVCYDCILHFYSNNLHRNE